MKIKVENIFPLTDLQRTPGKIVAKARGSNEPVVITQHGRPAVVMVDVKLFEELEGRAVDLEGLRDVKGDRKLALQSELDRISSEIISKYDPIKIILFGSLANGTVSDSSDIDLVVIKKTNKKFWDRQKELAKIVRPKLACDIIIYTPEEWQKSLDENRGFATNEILARGKVIYDKAA